MAVTNFLSFMFITQLLTLLYNYCLNNKKPHATSNLNKHLFYSFKGRCSDVSFHLTTSMLSLKIQNFQIPKSIASDNQIYCFHLTKQVIKISSKHLFFLSYIYINIYTEIPKQRLRRKYKNPQGIVIKHFVFLASPLQKTMESTLFTFF